ILPYLEQGNAYRLNDLLPGTGSTGNLWGSDGKMPTPPFPKDSGYMVDASEQRATGPVRQTPIKTYYCPSRRASRAYWDSGKHHLIGLNDYASAVPGRVPLRANETPDLTFWGDNGKYLGVI